MSISFIRNKTVHLIVGLFFVVGLGMTVTSDFGQAGSASLSISSPTTVNAGDTFTAVLYAQSPEQSLAGVTGQLQYPTDMLDVESINDSGIVSSWAQNPVFSNDTGTASFQGTILNPGFQGKNGKIATIIFHAKKQGVATVKYRSGAIEANDAEATNILSGLGSATVAIGPEKNSSTPSQPTIYQPSAEPTSLSVSSTAETQDSNSPSQPIISYALWGMIGLVFLLIVCLYLYRKILHDRYARLMHRKSVKTVIEKRKTRSKLKKRKSTI